jgi:hypothetical protein
MMQCRPVIPAMLRNEKPSIQQVPAALFKNRRLLYAMAEQLLRTAAEKAVGPDVKARENMV